MLYDALKASANVYTSPGRTDLTTIQLVFSNRKADDISFD